MPPDSFAGVSAGSLAGQLACKRVERFATARLRDPAPAGCPLLMRLAPPAVVARKRRADLQPDGARRPRGRSRRRLSDRFTTTLTRSAVPMPQRAAMRPALRTVAQLLVGDKHDLVTRIERIEHGRVGPRHVQHQCSGSARRRTRAACASAPVSTRRARPRRRAEQIAGRHACGRRGFEERLVETMRVLERVRNGEPRFSAEEHGRVAARHVQVDQQRVVRRGAPAPRPRSPQGRRRRRRPLRRRTRTPVPAPPRRGWR